MPNLNIKNVPRELYDLIKKRAVEHRRSMNSEILVSLQMILGRDRCEARRFLARLDDIQRRLDHPPLTDALLNAARRRGRP